VRQFEASIEGVVLSQRLLRVYRSVLSVNLMSIWNLLLLSAVENIKMRPIPMCPQATIEGE